MVGLLVTSKRTCRPGLLLPVLLAPRQATADHVSAGDPQTVMAGLAQSLVGHYSFPLGLGAHRIFCVCVCVLQESLFPPILGKFRNQTPLAFRVRFPGDFRSLCRIPRLGSLMWDLTWENECAVYGNSLYYLCNFSMNIKLF